MIGGLPNTALSVVQKIFAASFNLLLPDDCRLCRQPLTNVSRIPVCSVCFHKIAPLDAEYFCSSCRTPFRNAAPLDDDGRCELCRRGLRGFDTAFSFGSYEGELRGLIHLFKYGRVQAAGQTAWGISGECDTSGYEL